MRDTKGPSHTGPKSSAPIHLKSILAISAVESMELRTYHFTRAPKSQIPSMTWIATLFGDEACELC